MTSHLDDLKELAVIAFSGTSHVPEQRGQQIIEEYSAELTSDLEFIQISVGNEEQYIVDFKKYLQAWLLAHSKCMSAWMTGGANFPVQKAAKVNAAEQKRLAGFQEWRKWAIKAMLGWNRRNANSGAGETKTLEFTGGSVELNFQDNRLRHPAKPDADTIAKLKRNGFRWAPTNVCWQCQLTTAATHSVIAVADDIDIKKLFDLFHQGGR